jgi:hypothetical protein
MASKFTFYSMFKHLYMNKRQIIRRLAFIVGGLRCVKNPTLYSASIMSISVGDRWLVIVVANLCVSFPLTKRKIRKFANTV